MSASLATFASPLGAFHHANPSTASSHTPFSGLFTKKTSSSPSSSKKRSSPSSGDKKPLLIGRPVLISTSNGDLPAATPLYSAAPSPPPPSFSAGHIRTFSASSLISTSSASSRSASPPPPYSDNNRSSFLDFTPDDDEDEDLPAAVVAPLNEKALVDVQVVEARMHSWDVERVQQADARLVSDLKRMGF